jgi:hypothetical protein
VIEPKIVELIESPCSLIVGTVDADGLPDATRGWAAQVLDGGARIRLLLAANAVYTLANLRTTQRIALTATHFSTLNSVQVKGVALTVEEATDDDRELFMEFCRGCVRAIHQIDETPEEILWRFVPSGVVACVFRADELFDQTPGPEAGKCLAALRGNQ